MMRQLFNSDIYEFVNPDTGVHYWVYSHEVASGGGVDGTVMVTN